MMRGVREEDRSMPRAREVTPNILRLQPHVPIPRETSLHDVPHSSRMRWSLLSHFHSNFVVAVYRLVLRAWTILSPVLPRCDVSTSGERGMGDGFGGKRTAGGEIRFDDSCHTTSARGPPIVAITISPHRRKVHCL